MAGNLQSAAWTGADWPIPWQGQEGSSASPQTVTPASAVSGSRAVPTPTMTGGLDPYIWPLIFNPLIAQ